MYKWIDADGSVTYSNTPPPDRAKVTDLTKIEDINTVPADKRPQEAGTEKEKGSGDSTVAKPAAPLPATPGAAVTRSEPLIRSPESTLTSPDARTLPREYIVVPEPVTLPREPRAAQREPESAPQTTRGVQTEAVRDPCLTSPDPKCHERNKDRYHPYLGYAPGNKQPAMPAVGASNPTAAGGAVGGVVRR